MRDILAFGPAKSHPTEQAGVIDKIFVFASSLWDAISPGEQVTLPQFGCVEME